ncbi:glycoside hydrolase family 12 protein [Xylariaceae sp. AK1471]|nr:glycoside hydrolase family 12 protein [Xylariaceae sp. AK1471]
MKLPVSMLLGTLPSLGLAQSLCDQYGYYAANGYYFNNNMWGKASGSGSGCTYIDYTNGNSVGFHVQWQWSGGDNNVKAYPYAGRTLSSKKLVSQIGSIPSSVSWNYQGNNIRANVAYDLFTAANANHDTSSGDYELMIWLAKLGGVQPIGSQISSVNVAGQQWDLWEGYNGAMHVFSFVAPSQRNSASVDVKAFFNYLQSNKGFPASNQYLITAQFGSEDFTGSSATFTTSSFSLNVN